MKLNLTNIVNVLKDIQNYVFPLKKITNKFKNIASKEDLKNFIQERSAHVTQTTLYGYINKLYEDAKIEFNQRLKEIDWKNYHNNNPFKNSGLSLYKWSPISDNLKILDKEIVLNSIKLKWNLVENDFQNLTKNLYFN